MERILLFTSLLIGGLVWLLGSLRSTMPRQGEGAFPPESAYPWKTPLGILALVLPFSGFVVSWPTNAPIFSAGHGLGTGFLIGGIAALLAAGSLFRQRGSGGPAASMGIACAAAAIPILFLRASVIDALIGLAIGWFAVTFPLYLAAPANSNEDTVGSIPGSLAAGAGMIAALCGVAALGIWRDELTPALARTTWSATAILFGAIGALVALSTGFIAPPGTVSDPAKSIGKSLVPSLLFAALGAVIMKLFSVKIAPEPRLFLVALAGLVVWPAVSWLLRDAADHDSARNPGSSSGLPPLAVLLAAAGFVASYQMLQGFGAGIYVLSLWLSAAMMPRRMGGEVSLLLFATILVLYRVFATRYSGDLRGVNLTDQYALFGLIFGALLPGIMASLVGRRSAAGAGGVLAIILAGTLSLAAPAAVVLLFGGKSALALLLGLALGSVQVLRSSDGTPISLSQLPGLFSLAIALALSQFTGRILPLTEMTRLHKVQLLGWLIAGVIVALLLAEAATRARRETASEVTQ